MQSLWSYCLSRLQEELPNQHFNTWIRPLGLLPNTENHRQRCTQPIYCRLGQQQIPLSPTGVAARSL